MAGTATIRTYLEVIDTTNNNYLVYRSQQTSFTATVTTPIGPEPALVAIATGGTSITFSTLTTPALCKITNLDPTNFVEWGSLTDPNIGEILAQESYVVRLSRNLGTLRLVANTATVNVQILAFDA